MSEADARQEARPGLSKWRLGATSPWALLTALLVTLPLARVVLGPAVVVQHDIWISDLLHAQLPYRVALGQALRAGELPLWMPELFSGVPLLAQAESGALYPPNIVLFGLFEPFRALGLAFLCDALLAASGTWWLLRRQGVGPAGAALGALVFAWSGFMLTHLRHPNMHAATAWLPWAVLALERVLASGGRRGGPALALVLGLQLAAGHPQISYYTGLLLAARTLVHLLGPGRRAWLSTGLAVAAATALGGSLLAVQLLPGLAFTAESLGQVAPTWAYATDFPFRWEDLLVFVNPALVGSMETFDYLSAETTAWGNYGFVGLGVLFLALGRLLTGLRIAAVRGWGAVTLVSLVLILGHQLPLYELLWSWLPGMKLFRLPNRFLALFSLGVAMLAGLGLHALITRLQASPRARLTPVLGLGALLVTAAELMVHHSPRMPVDEGSAWQDPGPLPELLARHGLSESRLYVIDELLIWERAFYAAEGFKKGMDPYREAWTLPLGSSGLRSGLHSATGYTRMVHARTATFWQRYNTGILAEVHQPRLPDATDDGPSAALRSLLARGAVEVVLSPTALPASPFEELGRDGIFVYRNPEALPKAYLSTAWKTVQTIEETARWIYIDGTDEHEVPAVEGLPPSTAEAQLIPLTVDRPRPHDVRLGLPPGSPAGLVVFAESVDPGWTVAVDGLAAHTRVANGYQLAVEVPAGAREVVFAYRPARGGTGLALSAGSALMLMAWAGWSRRRRQAGGAERA